MRIDVGGTERPQRAGYMSTGVLLEPVAGFCDLDRLMLESHC